VSANAFDKSLDNDVGITPEDFIVKPVRVTELLDWLGQRLGLQWIEAERALSPIMPVGVTAGERVTGALPSLTALRDLEDQVHAGYIRGVHKTLDQIAISEPGCDAFVQRLRSLAKHFQLDTLANLIKEAAEAQAPSGPAAEPH
jgi:hypothetical protein